MHVSKVFPSLRDTLPRDLMASVVVFLVALPLCMGIAIASGMPPAKGLLTGIVGGLVVGFLAGSPLQVSGPAAGLAVLVFELVRTYGVAMLGPILLFAGAIQLLAGRLRLGCWFRVTSPAVVYGMLAGIGILIVLSQLHVMLDLAPKASGLDNLLAFPQAAFAALGSLGMDSGLDAALLGLGTIAVMWGWDKLRPQRLRFLPGALLGVSLATLASLWLALDVRRVEVPANLGEAIDWLRPADLLALADPSLLLAAVVVAFIASAETLLSAAAVDRLHDGPRSDMDRELSAQGVGNMLCGLLGALPMTGGSYAARPTSMPVREPAPRRSFTASGCSPSSSCSAACCGRFRWRAWPGCWSIPGSSWSISRPSATSLATAGCRCWCTRPPPWPSSSPTC